jgi:hypothetical protein
MVRSTLLDRHPDDAWTLADPMAVSARMHRLLMVLADAIVPESPRIDSTLHDVTRHTLVSLQYMPRSSAMLFLLGMRLINWSPLWRLRGMRPLTSVPRDTARRHLLALTLSRWLALRSLMYGPIGLFMSFYFDQDYVHRELDYAPVPFVEARIRLRRKWLQGDEPGLSDQIHRAPS